jgi:hypothetical protein
MKLFSIPKVLFTLVLSSLSLISVAQFNSHYFKNKTSKPKKPLKLAQRMEVGSFIQLGNGHLDHEYYYQNEIDGVPVYTHTQDRYKLKGIGYGGFVNAYVPFSYFNKTSLGFSIEANYIASVYAVENPATWNTSVLPVFSVASLYAGMPIGIDVRWGGETTLNGDDWGVAGFGAGVMPFYYASIPSSTYENFISLRARPYIKGEFGFKMGVLVKLRGMVFFNKLNLLEHRDGMSNGDIFLITQESKMMTNSLTYTISMSYNFGALFWQKGW